MSNNTNFNPDNIRTAGHDSIRMFSETAHTLLDTFMGTTQLSQNNRNSNNTNNNNRTNTTSNQINNTNSNTTAGDLHKIPDYYISSRENFFTYYFLIPGVSKENSSVKVNNGKLVITGKTNFQENTIKNINYKRTLDLPRDIHINDISATLNNGVFEINLPKKNENIEIRAN